MRYLVYGNAWFSAKINADSEDEARLRVTEAMLNDIGVAINIKEIAVEEDDSQIRDRTNGDNKS
jgi:hypothetical protein